MTLYLKNATFIDWKTLEFKPSHLAVSTGQEDQLTFLETLPEKLEEHDQILDCRGKLVTKSFGCGHHHIYSTLARGMPAPKKTPTCFLDVLNYIWWNIDKNLEPDMIKASALAAALYCAKNGVTFVIDHHASPFAVTGSLQTIAEAFESVGISHLLCYEISDRDGKKSRDEGLSETEQYLQDGHQGLVGLHASFTVSTDTLNRAVTLAETYNSGIHVHVAEGKADQEDCLKNYNTRVIKRFHAAGALNLEKTILGHCVHLDAEEKQLLKNSKAWIVQNVESNLNNNVGLGNYQDCGSRIMLGTDGMHSDMIRSAKAAYFVGQTTEGIDFLQAYQRFRNIHRYLESNHLQGEADNNLVILDYNPPTEVDAGNVLGHFLFGIESGHVESVIASGKLIVKEGRLLTASEDDILSFAREMGNRLWKKL